MAQSRTGPASASRLGLPLKAPWEQEAPPHATVRILGYTKRSEGISSCVCKTGNTSRVRNDRHSEDPGNSLAASPHTGLVQPILEVRKNVSPGHPACLSSCLLFLFFFCVCVLVSLTKTAKKGLELKQNLIEEVRACSFYFSRPCVWLRNVGTGLYVGETFCLKGDRERLVQPFSSSSSTSNSHSNDCQL